MPSSEKKKKKKKRVVLWEKVECDRSREILKFPRGWCRMWRRQPSNEFFSFSNCASTEHSLWNNRVIIWMNHAPCFLTESNEIISKEKKKNNSRTVWSTHYRTFQEAFLIKQLNAHMQSKTLTSMNINEIQSIWNLEKKTLFPEGKARLPFKK